MDVQREWWARQKKDRYEKACVLVLQAHVRLAGKVQLSVQDKKKQPTEHLEAQALAARTVLPTLSDAPSAPPSPTWDWEGLTDNVDTRESRTGYDRAAPVKVENIPGGGERGRATTLALNPRLKMTFVSLTPGDTMKFLGRLPALKPHHNNAEFWQRLREMQICHNLHNRDVAGLVWTKLPENLWSRLQPAHQNGSWCADLSDSRREQEVALADFKADVSEALSHTPVDWNAIVGITQKPEEGAQEYGVRNFEAFRALSGVPNADRQNPAFVQLNKDGLHPTHQAVLRTGLVPYVTFSELENRAMSLANRAAPGVAAVSTDVCLCCKQTGHRKAQCPLSYRRPWGPGPKWGQPPSQPQSSRPHDQDRPRQGVNSDRSPHKPHSPSPKPTAPDWDQLSQDQLLKLLQLLARRKD
ncbi:hypothetical protein chiPu_0024580 [Chiloscyllium punctatum]|uniref:CCHC-type domain-containing protein n=1 Tax=Chiloscyllium punctatum TaxID=137246 RepID=A0A401TE89_CHIPU|nr:hypothetical protein [Chiloscyllium punctatum]